MVEGTDEAISVQRQALALLPLDDARYPQLSSNQQALYLTPEDNSNRPSLLASLGGSPTLMLERLKEIGDIHQTVPHSTKSGQSSTLDKGYIHSATSP